MKFEQYVQLVTGFIQAVFSPLIGYFGVYAWQLNDTSLIADFALIVLTVTMFCTALLQMVAAVKVRLRVYVGLLYTNLLLSSFLALLVVGLMLLADEMGHYLSSLTSELSPDQRERVQIRIDRMRMSLIGYACLAFAMSWVYNGVTLAWVGLQRVLKTVLPCYFLIEMVYSGFLFLTGFRIYTLLVVVSPEQGNPISIAIMASGLLLFLAGLAGLLAHGHRKRMLALGALVVVTLANLAFLVLGSLTCFDADMVDQFLGDNWQPLAQATGGTMSPQDYVHWGRLNLKFAGLCYLSFFLVSVPLTPCAFWALRKEL